MNSVSLILSCHLCLLLISKCQHGFNDYDGFNSDPFGTLQTFHISHVQAFVDSQLYLKDQ